MKLLILFVYFLLVNNKLLYSCIFYLTFFVSDFIIKVNFYPNETEKKENIALVKKKKKKNKEWPHLIPSHFNCGESLREFPTIEMYI